MVNVDAKASRKALNVDVKIFRILLNVDAKSRKLLKNLKRLKSVTSVLRNSI